MEKQEKFFLKRLAQNIARDEPCVSDKKIKTYFHSILDNLPNGELHQALVEHQKNCIQFLIRLVRKTISRQETSGTGGQKKKKNGVGGGHSQKVADKPVQDAASAHPSPKEKHPKVTGVVVGKSSAVLIGGQIVHLLQRKEFDEETGDEIERLWSQVDDPAGQSDFAGLDRHCLMLMMTDGCADLTIFRNILSHCFSVENKDMIRIQHISSTERMASSAREKLKPLCKFLKMSMLRRSRFAEEPTMKPSVADYMIALLSLYLDLFVIAYREAELTVGTQRRMTRLAKQVTSGSGESALDSVLQMTVTEYKTVDFCPLLRYLMREKPGGKRCFSHYLRHVLTACKWKHLWTDLQDIVQEVRLLRAPKGFVDWVKRWNPDACQQLPSDRKFKGRTVTSFLLDDADEDMIASLMRTLLLYERGSAAVSEEVDSDTDRWEGEKPTHQVRTDREAGSSSKKPKKTKKKKAVTIDEGEDQDEEDRAFVTVVSEDDDAAQDGDDLSDGGTNAPDVDMGVEVYDWTSLGQPEASVVPDSSDLFMIDGGGKQPSATVGADTTGPPPKKKRKKPESSAVVVESEKNATFFVDRGQKMKKRSEIPPDELDLKAKKIKKTKKAKEGGCDDGGGDGDATRQERSADRIAAQHAPTEEPEKKKKKKKKASTAIHGSSAPPAVENEMMDETILIDDLSEIIDEEWAPNRKQELAADVAQSMAGEGPRKKKKELGSAQESSAPSEDQTTDVTGFFLDQGEKNHSSSSSQQLQKKKKKRGSEIEGGSPSAPEKNMFEGLGLAEDLGRNDDSGASREVLARDTSASVKKERRSGGEGREGETRGKLGDGLEKKGEREDSVGSTGLGTSAVVSASGGERTQTDRTTGSVTPVVSTSTVASLQITTPKENASDNSTPIQKSAASGGRKLALKSPPFKEDPSSGGKKRTPRSETSVSESEPSSSSTKRKRKMSDPSLDMSSPITRSEHDITQTIRSLLEKWSENSSSGSGDSSFPAGSSTAPTSKNPPPPNDESFVPESVSEGSSEGDLMVPNLRVHLKTQPPAGSAVREGSGSPVVESMESPVFASSAKSSPAAVLGIASPAGPALSADGAQKTLSQTKRRRTVSSDRTGKSAGAPQQESEEPSKKTRSPRKEAKRRKSSIEGGSKSVEEMAQNSPAEMERRKGLTPAKAERKDCLSTSKTERKDSLSTSKTKRKNSLTPAKAERRKSLTPAKAERKNSLSTSKTERKNSLTPSKVERRKSLTEDLGKRKTPVGERETKTPMDGSKSKSPAEKVRKSRSSAKETEAETDDSQKRRSGSAGTPHDGTGSARTPHDAATPKAPKSTTPVSRRTRAQRKSTVPTASAPQLRPAQEAGAKSSDRDADVETDSPKPVPKARKDDAPSVSQTDSRTAKSRRSMRSETSAPSEGTGVEVVTPKPSSTSRSASTLPPTPADALYSSFQKVTRKSVVGPQTPTSPPSHTGQREADKQQPETRTVFTKLKKTATAAGGGGGAEVPEPAASQIQRKTSAREAGEGARDTGGNARSSPSRKPPSSPGKTSPAKSALSSTPLTSASPDRQTRSQSHRKMYNLRRSIMKVDQ